MTLTLDRISNVEMNDEKKALLMAETHLGRGWLAFLLYDFYGPIPIPTLEDLKLAAEIFCVCVKLVSIDKLLAE